MNKHIKHIQQLLEHPTYLSEKEAKDYLECVIKSGKLKPNLTMGYQKTGDYFSTQAATLPSRCIGIHKEMKITVYGVVQEDYYKWVNFFLCVSDNGKEYIVGDFEAEVYTSSKGFYDKFISSFEVEEWDYWDI